MVVVVHLLTICVQRFGQGLVKPGQFCWNCCFLHILFASVSSVLSVDLMQPHWDWLNRELGVIGL